MRLLLDTHVVIWTLAGDHMLPKRVRDLVEDGTNQVFLSVASLWELAIKASLKRGSAPDIDPSRLTKMCADLNIGLLPISAAHALAVMSLPHLHGDPFDRLLVAQAKVEPMRLVTRDKIVAAYDENAITW